MLQLPDCEVQQCTLSVFLAVAERINFNILTTFCSHYFISLIGSLRQREMYTCPFCIYCQEMSVLLASRCSYCNAKSWTIIFLCCCCCFLTKFPKQEMIVALAGQCKQLFHMCRWLRTHHDLCDTSASLRIPLKSAEFFKCTHETIPWIVQRVRGSFLQFISKTALHKHVFKTRGIVLLLECGKTKHTKLPSILLFRSPLASVGVSVQ